MTTALALIPIDLTQGSLGLPARMSHLLHGQSVLAHTLSRAARISQLAGIVLLHPAGQDPLALVPGLKLPLPLHTFAVQGPLRDPFAAMRISARKPAVHSWRGGLGGVTCYDEILCTAPMHEALAKHDADAALLLGPDWLLVDPAISGQVLQVHLEYPQAMPLTFSQAAPGLAGLAISRELLGQFAQNQATIGQVLSYNPQRPQADPIGRDVCAQILPGVRDCPHRVIYDTPRSIDLIDQLAQTWDAATFAAADASQVAAALGTMASGQTSRQLPRQVTLELTPRRAVRGPLLPQYHVKLDRPDLSLETAQKIFAQLGASQDTFLVLGGLGDALLHPQWRDIAQAAHEAGIWGLGIETDLLVEQDVLAQLLDLPIDVLSVRINADTSATYRKMMAPDDPADHFKQCIENLQWLINTRNARWQKAEEFPHARPGVPWIVPSLVKTADTFGDMETFFDRWMVYTSHAVIAPAQTGCGLMPALSPVNMTPPRRRACRQLAQRLTIHSDGRLAQCDQDWLARGISGNTADRTLEELLATLHRARSLHEQGRWTDVPLCGMCEEWHRP